MSKREGELKSAFSKEFKKQLPHFLVLFHSSRAAPDRSITGGGRTSFFEFKHGTPNFETHGDQLLMCRRLAAHGFCRYVIWEEKDGVKRTLVIHPERIHDGTMVSEDWCGGFDHKWLTSYIKKIHSKR